MDCHRKSGRTWISVLLKGSEMKTKIAMLLLSFVAMVASFMLPDPRFMTDAYGQSIIDPDIPNPIIFAAQAAANDIFEFICIDMRNKK